MNFKSFFNRTTNTGTDYDNQANLDYTINEEIQHGAEEVKRVISQEEEIRKSIEETESIVIGNIHRQEELFIEKLRESKEERMKKLSELDKKLELAMKNNDKEKMKQIVKEMENTQGFM
jgi:hypothetical protein